MPPPQAARERKTPKRAPGPGKQPKKFTEDQGMAHLLALSQHAVDKTDTEYQHRVDRTHAALSQRKESEKERRKKKMEAKKSSETPTRAAMLALLREKRRQKSRERKSHRRHRDEGADDADAPGDADASAPGDGPRPILKSPSIRRDAAPKKRVSFH